MLGRREKSQKTASAWFGSIRQRNCRPTAVMTAVMGTQGWSESARVQNLRRVVYHERTVDISCAEIFILLLWRSLRRSQTASMVWRLWGNVHQSVVFRVAELFTLAPDQRNLAQRFQNSLLRLWLVPRYPNLYQDQPR